MRLKNLIWVMALICKWDSFAWSPTYREFDTRAEVVSQPSTYKDVQGNEWSYQVDGSTVKCDGPIYDVSGRLLFAWPVFNVGWENWQFYYYELNQKKWSDNYGLYLNFYPTGQIEVYPWFIDSRASLTLPLGCKFVSQKCISSSNWGAIFDSIRWSMGASYDSASFYDKCLMHPETKSMAVQMMACKDDYLQKYLKNLLRFDTTAKSLYPCSATVTDRIKTYYDENLSLGASVQIPIVARRDARLSILPETTEVITESTLIQIKVPHPDVEVHYTIDGSSPNRNSPRCDGLMGLPVGTRTVKALGYWGGEVCTLLETANFLVEDLPDDVRVVSLNLDATGGGCCKTQLRRREGASLGYIPIPVKEGFDFDGWWTQREGGCQVSAETIITQSATFYAHWKVVGGSVDTGLYCVIDLSRGAFAPSYTVSYLDKMPIGGWSDEYKTTKLVLRRVESGGFKMGDGVHGNKARVAVLTKPFYIGVFEVTRRQWELVMGSLPPSSDAVDCVGGAHPVNGISYDLVRGSCDGSKWPESNMVDDVSFFGKLQLKTGLNFDLPTEAQWEYSCRAGTESDYNNGGNFNEVNQDPNMDAVGRYRYNGGEISRMAEVGSYQPNSWGLYDMHGNVWEWCLDWYDEPCSLVDPVGPLSGALRIIRGGGWYNLAQYCTSSYRTADAPSRNYEDFGFRVALAVDSEVAKEAIVYDANGGQSALTWQMVEHGKFIDELPPATLDGFEFLGWFTSQTGGEMVKGPLLVEESKVLYAHWRSITDEVSILNVVACQQYPQNGLVDITVTFQGASNAVAQVKCAFVATNSATKTAIPVEHITRNGEDAGSGNIWTRKFIWDAKTDVGAAKIDDIALTIHAEIQLGGVQLWEDGPYWAECNVGATKPEECGCYFWWGDTIGYKRNEDKWEAVDGAWADFSFEQENCPTYGVGNVQLQSAVYIDSLGNLEAKYDAATVQLGAPWRMPTDEEFAALVDNCTATWTEINGVPGRLVRGIGAYASKSIFLPATGFGNGSDLYYFGSGGYYWSSTPNFGYSSSACYLVFFSSSGFNLDDYLGRDYGLSVRPLRGFADVCATGDGATAHLAIDCRDGQEACAISFDPMGGSVDEMTRTVSKDSQVGTLPLAVRDGYEFAGWFTAVEGGTRLLPDTIITEDVTYYAHWRKVEIEEPKSVFHVDASDLSTMEIVTESGKNYVVRWNDASGGGIYATAGSVRPMLKTVNDKQIVDFGGLRMENYGSENYGAWMRWSESDRSVREVFIVCCDNPEGNVYRQFVLTSDVSDWTYDFHRSLNLQCVQGLFDEECASDRVKNGLIQVDGTTVPYDYALPEGLHVLHIRTTGNVTANTFAKDRTCRYGGLMIAEVIVYDEPLDDETAGKVQQRLIDKWLALYNDWRPKDVTLPKEVSGGAAITIPARWVTESLPGLYGEDRIMLFRKMFGSDYGAALLKKTGKVDCAGNELFVWQDYVAGTDPTDSNSLFRAFIDMVNGCPQIRWEPNLNGTDKNRIYTVFGKYELSDEQWHSPTNGRSRFFKVSVEMP